MDLNPTGSGEFVGSGSGPREPFKYRGVPGVVDPYPAGSGYFAGFGSGPSVPFKYRSELRVV